MDHPMLKAEVGGPGNPELIESPLPYVFEIINLIKIELLKNFDTRTKSVSEFILIVSRIGPIRLNLDRKKAKRRKKIKRRKRKKIKRELIVSVDKYKRGNNKV